MTMKNFRVGGLVVLVVDDSVAVNIRKSLNFFPPFEFSKLGTLLSSLPVHLIRGLRKNICDTLSPYHYLSSSFLRTKISREK